LDVALASFSEALDRGEDSHRCLPVDAAYIATRVLRPVDFPHLYRRLLLAFVIVRREVKIGEDIFMRDSLPIALLEPGLRLGNRVMLVLAFGFVIDWGIRNCAGDGIEETFEHTNRGRDLVRSKVLDQFVGKLFVSRHKSLFYTAKFCLDSPFAGV
jgi:hypothetical protein